MVLSTSTVLWLFGFIAVINAASKPGKIVVAECPEDKAAENAKYFKESCSNDTDCFGNPTSMVCKDKTCQCADSYIPEQRFVGEKGQQTVCTLAPALYQRCKSACQKPGTCAPYTGEDAKGNDVKICQCVKPYLIQDGSCILACKSGEYYDGSKDKCVSACKSTEVQVNENCVPFVGLKGKCQAEEQCQVANSECKSGSCSCLDGFIEKNGLCIPKEVNCPVGEPLKSGDGYQTCTTIYKQEDQEDDDGDSNKGAKGVRKLPPRPIAGKPKDDCPSEYACLATQSDYDSANKTGFCCPALKSKCPVGAIHPTASCNGGSSNYCPYLTHFCHTLNFGSTSKQLCCPKECSSGLILLNGKCYQLAKINDQCVSDKQCGYLAQCSNGVCKCKPGAKSTGNYPSIYCSMDCQSDEVLKNDVCEKRFKLGDYCKKSNSYKCPSYAYCNTNKQCACECGTFTLADNVCAPAPICRPPPVAYYRGAAGKSDNDAPPPPIPRISDEERDKLLKNVTFCKIKDKTPPAGVKVGQCPSNQYCSNYITDLGLCCPKPKAECFGGGKAKSDKLCDAKDPLSCGLDYSCFKYVYPVDQDQNSKDNTICCPNGQGGDEDNAAGPA